MYLGQPVSILRALAVAGYTATLFDEVVAHVVRKHLFAAVNCEGVLALAPKP